LYGGAKGGGKSVFFCRWAYLQCQYLINLFGLNQKMTHPLPVGFLGRKRGTDFKTTTLETWKKFIDPSLYRIRDLHKEIIIDEKVKIFFGGLDDEHNINKFNSAEFAFVGIDQAEEINRTDLALLKGTLRLKYENIEPSYKVLLTANPAPCFLRQDYIESPNKDGSQLFIQALPKDNPYLPKSYIPTLIDAFKHRPELVEAYVNGSWDQLEGGDILIKHKWVIDAVEKQLPTNLDRRVTVCDIAWQGNDETVIYNMIDNRVVGELIFGAKQPEYSAAKIMEMSVKNNSDLIALDCDGFGGGVAGLIRVWLSESKSSKTFYEIRSGKNAENEDQYVNSRTEMWFHAAKLLADGEVSIPNDQVLIGQLTGLKYSPNGSKGRFAAETSKDYKARMDGSPDRACGVVYGWWATSKVTKNKFDFNRVDQNPLPQKDGYGWNEVHGGSMVASGLY